MHRCEMTLESQDRSTVPSEVSALPRPLPSSQALGHPLKQSSLLLGAAMPQAPPPQEPTPLCAREARSCSPCSWEEGLVHCGQGFHSGTISPHPFPFFSGTSPHTHAHTRTTHVCMCTHTCPPPQTFWGRDQAEAQYRGGVGPGEQASSSAPR